MKKNVFTEKRANIPITILVLGVLTVCFLTLLSFYSSDIKNSNSFSKVTLISVVNLVSDKVTFYSINSYLDEPSLLNEINPMYSSVSFSGGTLKILTSKGVDSYVFEGKFISNERKFLIIPYEKEVLYIQYPYTP